MNSRTSKLITDRHKNQYEIFSDETRFRIAVCGRRWGKTVLGRESALKEAYRIKNANILILAPTRQMVKELFWEGIKSRARELSWKFRLNETELKLQRITNNSTIQLLSADRPERARGRGNDFVILDEYSDMGKEIWSEVLRPSLADRNGKALFIGTPKGRNHFYELFEEAKSKEDWTRYSFKTIDSPYIPKEEIENARTQLDERTFRQEFEASFESYEGRAYCYYEQGTHQKEQPFNVNLPIIISADFNITPCIWEMAQQHGTTTHFFDEIKQNQTDIWRMCNAAKDKIAALVQNPKRHKINFYGDYTSASRRDVAATSSSWQIIRDEFKEWNAEFYLRSNPDRKSTRLNSSHVSESRMPSSA